MAWALTVTQSQSMTKPRILVAHFDGHGICSAAALIRAGLRVDRVICIYDRTGGPQTHAEGIEGICEHFIPPGSEVIIIDIPVNVKNPQSFINALAGLRSKECDVYYFDHHETSLPYMLQLLRHGIFAVYTGPGAYDLVVITNAMIGSGKLDEIADQLAIIGAICDRSSDVIKYGKWSATLQEYADALDVMIRNMSAGGKADYSQLILDLANRGLNAIDINLAKQIPVPNTYESYKDAVLALEQLHPAWGPKSLEKLAIKCSKRYAVGVSYDQRNKVYVVRAIILWTEKAANPQLPSPGPALSEIVRSRGLTIYGHPDAPVIGSFTDFNAALEFAREIARILGEVRYVSRVSHLIEERTVAEAVSSDFAKILEYLERIAKALETGAEAKQKQVELLEQLYERERRTRYD